MTEDDLRALYRDTQQASSEPVPAFRWVLNRKPRKTGFQFNWAVLVPSATAMAAISLVWLNQAPEPSIPEEPNVLLQARTDDLLMAQAITEYQRSDLLLPETGLADGNLSTSDVFFTSTDFLLTP